MPFAIAASQCASLDWVTVICKPIRLMTDTVTSPRTIRLGSRKSQLAMIQTEWVKGQLQKHHPQCNFEIHSMSTKGDKILDVALAKIGDKALFTKELETGMLNNETDLAVHSLKDLPTNLPEGLVLGCITEREDPSDALIVREQHGDKGLGDLPDGAAIGTSSLRRQAQLRHHFPHLTFKDIRGNLNTRLAKLDEGGYDALVLAISGLTRLGVTNETDDESKLIIQHKISHISPEICLHAVGQGALGIECRDGDTEILDAIALLAHQSTTQRCLAERAFLRTLEGGCQIPIGVNTSIEGDRLTLTGMVASLDGQRLIQDKISGATSEAEQLGIQLAEELRGRGAGEILAEILAEVDRH